VLIFTFVSCSNNNKEAKVEKSETMKVINVKAHDINGDGKVFACTNCKVVSDESGECSSCGGHLHEMKVEEAQAKMGVEHKHGEGESMYKDNHKAGMDVSMMDKNHDGKVYQCPMCADQISDEPSECGNCGMALKETTVKEANENLSKTKKS